MGSLSLTAEHQEALRQYELLREAVPVREQEKEHLLYHVKPELEGHYFRLVGKNKLELLHVRTKVFELRRKMEMIQACINQDRPVLPDVIDVLLEAEMKEHYRKVQEEAKKMEEALVLASMPELDPASAEELKKLYYKLAKQLHPDLHPDATAEQLNFWQEVSEAYRMGDLQKMQLMEILVNRQDGAETDAPRSLDAIKGRIEKLRAYLQRLVEDIAHIKTGFPFSLLAVLNDPEWAASENRNTLHEISLAQEEIMNYEKMIALLLAGPEE